MKNPDLYLDVDGVLLFERVSKSPYNEWLMELVRVNRQMFDRLFWLSAWTHHGTDEMLLHEHPRLRTLGDFKALPWKDLKTEAIDWSHPFVWIEDGVLTEEREMFEKKAVPGQHLYELRPGEWSLWKRGERT